jgi:two-component system LytT family sensor kinase
MVNISKIWVRFLVVFLIHIMIKSFDLSFPRGPFELSLRSLLFTLYFIGYGILVWYFAEWFDKAIHKIIKNPEADRRKMILITFYHSLFAYVIAFSINHFYRLGDVYLFGNIHIWEDISLFNPELTISLLSIYLIIFGFNRYSIMQNRVQEGALKTEKLQKENILARYQALKAQIEPHFLFNSLSVLSSLVYKDADLSSDFIVKLSKTLRYVIEKNESHLVKLSDELEFLDSYFFLIKTRLDDGIFLENKLEKSFVESTFIPPVTLQLLVENAINHNKYNPEKPLKIKIDNEANFIVVRNNLNLRKIVETSTKQGLKNIARRYELISGEEVEIKKTETEFIVRIPVLNQTDYERFNI